MHCCRQNNIFCPWFGLILQEYAFEFESLWWQNLSHDQASKATKGFVQFAKGHRPVATVAMSIWERTLKTGGRLLGGITVEPIFFLYNLNFATYYIIFQNLQIEKACRVNLNQTEIICSNLKDPANQNVQVTSQKKNSSIFRNNQIEKIKKSKNIPSYV